MAVYGNTTGPLYCFGKIIVAVAGTPVQLSQNNPVTTGFGTPAGGVPQYSQVGSPAPMVCNQILFDSYSTNTGNIYICIQGSAKGKGDTNSILKILSPGSFFSLSTAVMTNVFEAGQIWIDADTANNAVQVSAVIL